jgi:uncharacterized membrane protein
MSSSATESPRVVAAADAARLNRSRSKLRERVRNSLLVLPAAAVLVAIVLGEALVEFDYALANRSDDSIEVLFEATASSVQGVTAAVATAMLTFIGVVFSLTILALQMASSQFSPRVMRTFVRSRMTKWTMAIFMATFTYSLVLLANIEPGNDDVDAFLPAVSFLLLIVLVFTSLLLFVAYVNNVIRLVRVGHIIDTVARETRRVTRRTLVAPSDVLQVAPPPSGSPITVVRSRKGGVLGGVDVRRLARIAASRECTLEVRVRIGEYVGCGQTVVIVRGERSPSARRIRSAVVLDTERTMFDDPAFGLRQLVDIASRALSPGINDPTTAVQALDRITEAMIGIGQRADPPANYLWKGQEIRLVRPVHDWPAFVELAFTEVRRFGHDSPQIARRLAASIDDLLHELDEHRHPPLLHQRRLLEDAVRATALPPAEQRLMLIADRSGLG